MMFLKPASSIVQQPGAIEIPKGCQVHHESIIANSVELGVVIGKPGRDIQAKDANDHIKATHLTQGYVLALDMTARNLQAEAKANGTPWTVAKGYDTFTPLGDFIPKSAIDNVSELTLQLFVDGHEKQLGQTKDMIFDIPKLIEYASSVMKFEANDIILTGTPSGVGPVHANQVLVGKLISNNQTVSAFRFPVVDRQS
jgi:acylpyruvate hydrolase